MRVEWGGNYYPVLLSCLGFDYLAILIHYDSIRL
jgi:hypothetical protein